MAGNKGGQVAESFFSNPVLGVTFAGNRSLDHTIDKIKLGEKK
jgi:hypothetical protein